MTEPAIDLTNLPVTVDLTAVNRQSELESRNLVVASRAIVVAETDDDLARIAELGKLLRGMRTNITGHYKKIKQPMDAAKQAVLDAEKEHLAPIDTEIARLNTLASNCLTKRQREADEEARRKRALAEEQARKEQEKLLAQAARASRLRIRS